MVLILLARIASRTLNVAMVFCSRSRPGMLEAKPNVGIGGEMEHQISTRHGFGQPRRIQEIALDQSETLVRRSLLDKSPRPCREIIIANDNIAAADKTVNEIAPNKASGACDEDLHD